DLPAPILLRCVSQLCCPAAPPASSQSWLCCSRSGGKKGQNGSVGAQPLPASAWGEDGTRN
uniref:Uncharacterized protein n=1 Tax=Meleagris gallopavo TaxID=9103 RepID=A0A803XP14_MELGA